MLEKQFSKVVSYLFHPLFMPTLGAVLVLNIAGYISFTIPPQLKYLVYGIIFLNTFVFPTLATYYLLKKGYISGFEMATIRERRIPMLLTAVFYFFTYYILRNASLPPVLFLMILGATLSVLLTLIITLTWKISAHMVGMGGITGAIIAVSLKFGVNMQALIIGMLLLSGLVGYARITLEAHTHNQVYWGYALGLGSMMLLLLGV
jgi:hypothetical protein